MFKNIQFSVKLALIFKTLSKQLDTEASENKKVRMKKQHVNQNICTLSENFFTPTFLDLF